MNRLGRPSFGRSAIHGAHFYQIALEIPALVKDNPARFSRPMYLDCMGNSHARKRRAEMKRLLVVTLLTLMMLTSVAVTAQTTHFKFNQDGEYASFSQSTDPSSSLTFSVSRNSSTGAATNASI